TARFCRRDGVGRTEFTRPMLDECGISSNLIPGNSLSQGLTYPTVTVTLVPVERDLTLTVPIAVSLRHLAPATLTQSLSASTTGRGHQEARAAAGTLTFYNGEFTAQNIAAGTVFTGSHGIK